MSELLSIIVPVYNGEDSISRCLDSIYRQKYPNIELIIIDDGSTDNSYEYIEKYIKENVKNNICASVYRNENQGVSKTRNYGIEISKGNWITFIDQDDYIDDNYCDNYMSYINNKDVDIVVGGYERVSQDGKKIRSVTLKGDIWDQYMIVSPWAHIYRKSFIQKFRISFLNTYIGEDVYFNMTAYACTNKVEILKYDCGYKWVFNDESVSNSKQNKVSDRNNPLYLLEAIHKFYDDMPTKCCIDEKIKEYFFIRYIIWYELFTVKGSKKSEYLQRLDVIYNWLSCKYPNYLNNIYIYKKIKGEEGKIHFIILVLIMLKRINLHNFILAIFTDKR